MREINDLSDASGNCRHDGSVLRELEHIPVPAEPDGWIVAGRKSGLRDLEGALGLIANEIEALRQAVVVVTIEQSVLAMSEQPPMRRGILDDHDASGVQTVLRRIVNHVVCIVAIEYRTA